MRIAVVSSCYGGYDHIDPPPSQSIDAEWVMVTDQQRPVPGWNMIYEPRPDVHPRLAAKVAKCLPWSYTDADVTVWMDAACRLLQPDSLEKIVKPAVTAEQPIAQIRHPWRDCIYKEAEASIGMPKYTGRPIREQVEHYGKMGHPVGWGMWATGLIVRTSHASWSEHERLEEFGKDWLFEQCRWTYQDQLSEPFLLRKYGMRPFELPISLHGSGVLEWRNHRDAL